MKDVSVDIQTIWLNFQYIIMKECYAMLTMNIGTNLSYSRDKRRLFCSFLEVTLSIQTTHIH